MASRSPSSKVSTSSRPNVRTLYVVPADEEPDLRFERAVSAALMEVRDWLAVQLGGPTIDLYEQVVDVRRGPHPAAWFREHDGHGSPPSHWFWENAIAAAGARFDDPRHRYVIYIQAEPAAGQAIGGTSGVCLLPLHDLLGLDGRSMWPAEAAVSRWVGGLAHELGHALGLPHPVPCDSEPGHPNCRSLMYSGFRDWPDTYLLESEKQQLRTSPFIR